MKAAVMEPTTPVAAPDSEGAITAPLGFRAAAVACGIKAEEVSIGFERGVPVSLDGRKLGPVEMVTTLNAIAGRHGVGRLDLVENRLVGIKSRGVYETPAGTVLYHAHRELERLVLDRDTLHFKRPCPSATPSSSTTASGSPPCARPWPPSWTSPSRK